MIKERINIIKDKIATAALKSGRLPEDITLVAVTKLFPASAIIEALAAGQYHFGENYVQELLAKKQQVPHDALFHFIGHLQTNKAKHVAECCTIVETVDSLKLGKALHSCLEKLGKRLDILVQVNIGNDPNKSGILPEMTENLIRQLNLLERLRVCGLMTIPPLTSTPEDSRKYYSRLRELAKQLEAKGLFPNIRKVELSMGMSDDFHIAVEEGATIVRVGTAIFGHRQ